MSEQSALRKNVDIILGVLAWAVALSNFWVDGRSGQDNLATAIIFAIPGAWAFCVCTAMEYRQRKAIYLVWIWPSAFFAFMKWYTFTLTYLIR